jgi:F420-dependent oxidoreductase-like protein
VRIGIQASYAGGFTETAAEIRDLESAGLDAAMVAEVYTFDAVSQLGYLAAVTDRVELVSAILPIYSRTPALTAMTAAGLDFVSGGRFTLGLGASGPQVIEGWHGVPYDAPLQRTREVVEICRQVWRRDRLVHEGPKYTVPLPADRGTGLGKPLKLINTPVRERVPVMLAAIGPKNVQLAAEIAEAWEPIWFHPERAGDMWGDALAAGRAERDPALGELQVVAGVPVAIGEDVDALHDRVRPHLALYVGGMGARGKNFYNDLAVRYGYEAAAKEVQDLYLEGRKDEAAAALPEDFVRAVSLIGPEGYVAERVAAYAEAGVTTLTLQPLDDSREGRLRTVETMKRLAG